MAQRSSSFGNGKRNQRKTILLQRIRPTGQSATLFNRQEKDVREKANSCIRLKRERDCLARKEKKKLTIETISIKPAVCV